VHLIAPDKHTVCAEVFPEPVVCSPGRHVLAQCPDPTFHETVLFPVEALTRHFRRHCYKVDTHFTPHGTGVLVLALLDALQNPGARDQLRLHLAQAPHRQPGWTGDLGWRFDPPHAEDRLSLPRPPFIRCLSNRLAGGNNGMVDLYLNESPEPTPLDRVMLFGDSYGRDMASQLALVSRQLMYLRTPYLHLDLVDGARPDLVITQNAERYLPSTLCDSGRPVFFLMPFFKEQSHAISPEVAEAFSRFLTSGQRLPQL
jgi:hypothetical protein